MRRRVYLKPGEAFHEWTVLGFSHLEGPVDLYDCRCSCGREFKVRKAHLRSGRSKRCIHCSQETHGRSRSDVYAIWQTMISRCHRPNHVQYARYGARGIQVCPEWRASFEAFAVHIGERPSRRHSVDRIDNARGYEPGNVRWATSAEQGQNKRNNRQLTIDGTSRCAAEWARIAGVNPQTIHERLKRGWPEREAVFGKERAA